MAGLPFKVKAIYEYTSEHDDDLKFPVGQVISVTEQEGDDWYVGEYTDTTGVKHDGLFPKNFVEKYEPEVPVRPSRPARAKQEVQSPPPPAPAPAQEEETPSGPAVTKPQAPPVESPAATARQDDARSPPSATNQQTPIARDEPPLTTNPPSAELAASALAKAAPPPVKAKSNAFKDRIAAFNKTEQAPIAPVQPGRQAQATGFIKKPFVAPPPSSNSYVPPVQKQEPLHRPYVREEDPEIRQRQEEDRAAAEKAGLAGDAPPVAEEGDEDVPKPMSLKERMAMLQREQEAARQRQADTAAHKKDRKAAPKRPSEAATVAEDEDDGAERERSGEMTRKQSLDVQRDRPRVPSVQRRPPEPLSPVPAAPEHEILSGGEEADQSAAGETTEDDNGTIGPDDSDEKPVNAPRLPVVPPQESDVGDEGVTTEHAGEEEEEEEEEVDEEEQRKQRLRERMAKLSGAGPGVGGPFNPFGAPMPSAAAPKRRPTGDRKHTEELDETAASQAPQRVPIMPMPGLQRVQSPESDTTQRPGGQPGEDDDDEPAPPLRKSTAEERGAPPPLPKESALNLKPSSKSRTVTQTAVVIASEKRSESTASTADRPVPPAPPQDRNAPPAVPSESTRPVPRPPALESRPVPPPPASHVPLSPGPGSESDDEMSMHAKRSSAETSGIETPLPIQTGAPPVPGSREVPPRPLQSPDNKRTSYFGSEPQPATSDRRASRVPPPVPSSPLASPRPPPPPPPTAAPPSRQTTALHSQEDQERDERDYEGDYDTDIGSHVDHRNALKAPHAREPSLDDSTTTDDTPATTPALPASAPRAVPPPPPQGVPKPRQSLDQPRGVPPPVPFSQSTMSEQDAEYDPYRYTGTARPVPPAPGATPAQAPSVPFEPDEGAHEESSADDAYAAPTARKATDRVPPLPPSQAPQDRAPPLPPTPQQAPPSAQPQPRQSADVYRTPTMGRRSMDQGRPGGEQGQIAQDVDLSESTQWWTASQPLPPVFQNRNAVDLLSECEESTASKRGGRAAINKDIYVLFTDYSQTIIGVKYDSHAPSNVSIEQRHEAPPPKLRQDQLESYWQRFGAKIAQGASAAGNGKKDTTIGKGSPASLPLELIKQQPGALHPVGTRAYGALVYSNMANASTQQYDEIRPGDIITVRNAKFEGHHGTMRQKYKSDYGPSHVAVVDEWDGTKRSVRAWEQGREGKGKGAVRGEKFRLGDLRSGEVKVWRVVGRDWVGWESV